MKTNKTNKTYYLVYVNKGTIKIKECKRSGITFVPVDNCNYCHTRIPDKELSFEYGKIYCEQKSDLEYCISVIKEHYKSRELLLERSIIHAKSVVTTDVSV